MAARIQFSGPWKYRRRSMRVLLRCVIEVTRRRALKGPRRPGWNWAVEAGTEVLKRQLDTAFELGEAEEARRYLDSVVLNSPALSETSFTSVRHKKFAADWAISKDARPKGTMLYLHGGGYSFYPKSYANLIALLTVASGCRTLALDYRLAPEHPFPAQLEDALNAYRWLLDSRTDPKRLLVAGDSAGGNLTLALLLSLRDAGLPLPALGIALSPPTDFSFEQPSGLQNAEYDWIDERMAVGWANWFCGATERRNPLVSPVYADLRGLPPIYLQAGRAEILYDSIQAFAKRAAEQGADVQLESWADMNHDFQMFGREAPQSAEAIQRFGEVVRLHIGQRKRRNQQRRR